MNKGGAPMKVCLVVEGAYPYLTGGVSSWIHRLLLELDDVEFIIQTLIIDRKQKREMKYDIPPNVVEIQEIYLFDEEYSSNQKKIDLSSEEYDAFHSLFHGIDIQWEVLFTFFHEHDVSLNELLRGKGFLELTKSYYLANYSDMVFTDFLWSMRSMYEPLFSVLKSPTVEADLYHSLSTGYAGVFASMQKYIHEKSFLLSEHGIYTREREEELIKADWVTGSYKDIWINQFYKLSSCAYDYSDSVTSLFPESQEIQIELGCDREKTLVIPNGVTMEQFADLQNKDIADTFINIGAILRVTPIKDVKTMISAFYLAKKEEPKLKLWLIGPLDEDPEYVVECKELVSDLNLSDVIFTGTVNIKEYLGKMDFMILSSISEGQPLVILEAFSAKKPYIATNVGDCKNLIYGIHDDFGAAGIVVPIMNTEQMSEAMLRLAGDSVLRETMGNNGYKRARDHHQNSDIYGEYEDLYQKLNKISVNNEGGI